MSSPETERSNRRKQSRRSRDDSPPRHRRDSPKRKRDPPETLRETPPNSVGMKNGSRDPVDESIVAMEEAALQLAEKEESKIQPTFGLSGKLAEETNKVRGIALQFVEPPEARKPTTRWRFYVFKDGEAMKEPLYIHRQKCYLFGRERRIADVPTDHPSCSKQHAVLQYREVEVEGADMMLKKVVKPYIMDLGSTNGTHINGNRIEAQRYYELMEKDTVKFGNSSREYVLLHEKSAG